MPAESTPMPAQLTLTLYSSSFCGACASTRHTLSRVAGLLPDRVAIREINVADAPDVVEDAGVTTTPTVVIHAADGSEVMRASGAPTLDQVLAGVARAIG